MKITTKQAHEALQDLCSILKILGGAPDLKCVRTLYQHIEERKPQVAALFQEPKKPTAQEAQASFLDPINAGD